MLIIDRTDGRGLLLIEIFDGMGSVLIRKFHGSNEGLHALLGIGTQAWQLNFRTTNGMIRRIGAVETDRALLARDRARETVQAIDVARGRESNAHPIRFRKHAATSAPASNAVPWQSIRSASCSSCLCLPRICNFDPDAPSRELPGKTLLVVRV